ncbi:hypothetical protein [uncultured Moraxella sp.]|uniref:hypothetical protein n=1 Tax=uncultured Moraxella sp. TaxID=263769 RepID=UPI0025F9DB4B|nr:hypothetical protein [uncultured Moraxella sp.]
MFINNLTTKGFVLKASCLMITAAMLGACANGTNHHASAAPSTQLLFSDNPNSASNQAKSSLVSAISEHLNSERYVLSTYHYRAMPINHTGSIDEDADYLWTTALKTYEHKTTQDNANYKSDAYRTNETYADEGGELPYLRYDDEKAGIMPADVITREMGMGETYQIVDEEIEYNYESLRGCLGDLSNQLDEVILEKPTATSNDKAIKGIIKNIDGCVSTSKKSLDDIKIRAIGYQKQDIAEIQQCAINFSTDIKHILSPSRQYKSLSDEKYHLYDTVWTNYWACNQSYYYSIDVEPFNYIMHGESEDKLNAYANLRQCSAKHRDLIATLKAQNRTYLNDAEAHAQTLYDTSYCFATGVYDGLGRTPDSPIVKPTTPDEIDTLYMQYAEELHYDDFEMPKSRFGTWFDAYKQMKTAGKSDASADSAIALPDLPIPTSGMGGLYTNMMSSMLDYMKKSPEQLNAKNLYQYNNTVMTAISHHKPNERKLDTLFALDFHSATADQSVQLPMSMDFDRQDVTADVSAALPLMALVSPKHAPLPADMPNGLVKFYLPSELQGVLPLPVIYDALNRAFLLSVSELDGERFTPMAMTHDVYAKQIGASQVIKLNLSSKDMGKMFGIVSKQLANDLKAYIDAHPELYQAKADADSADTGDTADALPSTTKSDQSSDDQNDKLDAAKLKQAVDDWVLINQGYHTSDVGSLFALFESILPIGMDSSLYYYLDGHGKLIGLQSLQTMDDQMQNLRLQTVGQTRYSTKMIDHAYSKQFTQSFAQAGGAVDGNAWLAKIREENTLKSLAQDARDQYEFGLSAAAAATAAAAQAAEDAAAAAMGESASGETQCGFDDGQVICY